MRKPDGRKTLPDPNSSDRYGGSAFIFQCSAKENSEGGGVEWGGGKAGKHSDSDTQPAINRERLKENVKKREKDRRDATTEVKGMLHLSCIPQPPILSCSLFSSLSSSNTSLSKLCFVCLYSFLTFISPSRSSDPVSHILTCSTFTRGCRCKKQCMWREKAREGGLCITLHPVAHWLTLLSFTYHPPDLHESLQLKSSAAWKYSAVGNVWKTTHALLCPG